MHFNLKNTLHVYDYSINERTKNIYVVLYNSLKKAIINRAIDENTQLPPTRLLAKDLNISRSTVLKAYDLLIADKYVTAIQGSGYYVAPIKNKKIQFNLSALPQSENYPALSEKGKSFLSHIQQDPIDQQQIAFRPGLPPLDVFPIREWKKLTNEYWRSVKYSQLSYANTIGLNSLRKNIAQYLKIYRNIECDSNQIIITTGSLHSLSLIGDVLIDKGDEVIIENPTYPQAFHLLQSLKAKIFAAEIDADGIQIERCKVKNPKLIYTTPSNQYPTGIKMSMTRRNELISWIAKYNCLLIEDDYDHEFSNWESPISSIFSLDKQDRVIYLSTFNKLLHPSMRIGYMIVPKYLLKPITAIYQQSTRFVSPIIQVILNNFIKKNYLNKHIRNVIKTSIERKKIFIAHFNHYFENKIELDDKNTGLHIIGLLPNSINDQLLCKHFQTHGISVHPYSSYFINKGKKQGLVMGYCSVNNKLIKDHIHTMFEAYSSFIQEN